MTSELERYTVNGVCHRHQDNIGSLSDKSWTCLRGSSPRYERHLFMDRVESMFARGGLFALAV